MLLRSLVISSSFPLLLLFLVNQSSIAVNLHVERINVATTCIFSKTATQLYLKIIRSQLVKHLTMDAELLKL